MTSNNPEQSNCCQAPVKDHLSIQYPDKTPEELRGKTNYFLCMKCGEPCNLLEPEPRELEPTESWEEEFDKEFEECLLPSDPFDGRTKKSEMLCGVEYIKDFIRKVEKEAYERGKKEARSNALREAIGEEDLRKLQSLRKLCIDDDLLDLQSYGWEERADLISDAWEALKVIESLLTNPKDK